MSRSRSKSPKSDRASKYDRIKRHRSTSRERKSRDVRDRERDRYKRRSRSPRDNRRDRSPREDRRDRSPYRRRERSREKSRERKRDRRAERDEYQRERSRSRERKRDKDDKKQSGAVPEFLLKKPALTEKDYEGKSKEEIEMMKLMGFGSFDTTKAKHVAGNDVSAVHVAQKRKYRQYMNRKGGFNRPLTN